MAVDDFSENSVRLSSPLVNGETASFSSTDYSFIKLPRALNCSTAGTLRVNMGSNLISQSIYVVAGLNPYRVSKIYSSGSTAMDVVGMY